MRRASWVLGLFLAAGCADRPGVCAESYIQNSVRQGFCYEVDHPSQCPTFESGDDSNEFAWEYLEGGKCEDLEFPFDCGVGIWEDIETDCESGGDAS